MTNASRVIKSPANEGQKEIIDMLYSFKITSALLMAQMVSL